MAPAQGPFPDTKFGKSSGGEPPKGKKQPKKAKRKAISLDPLSLTYLATTCKHGDKNNENSGHDSQVNAEFFSAVLESVKPAVFFAMDTRVCPLL